MSKRMFEVIDEMNLSDMENDTFLIKTSANLLSAEKVKQGAKLTIAIDAQCMDEIAFEKSMAVLVIVDKDEYFKRKKHGNI